MTSESNGMNEEWRPVLGYEGCYDVSNMGRMRSHVAKRPCLIMRQYKRPDGYWQIQLKINQVPRNSLVHILVDEAFNGPRVPGLDINHIDGNKANNLLSNLERATRSENALHAHRTGLCSSRKGEGNSFAKMTDEQVKAIRSEGIPLIRPSGHIQRGTASKIAARYGVTARAVCDLIHGRGWAHIS